MKQSVQWFLDLYQNGQLDLAPPYQRRSVWTLRDRKFFLDTIFRNYPSPAIFIHKDLDKTSGRMNYHVVDGKQRIETIVLFTGNAISMDKEYGDVRIEGRKWKSIEKEPDLKTHFSNYLLPVEFIDAEDSLVINEVFDRLNRTSRKLERQELRHARYDGWFIRLVEAEAEANEWERLGIVTKARMRRMRDVQYISELLMVLLRGAILGFNQDTLDDFYAEYDSPLETSMNFDEGDFKRRLAFSKRYMLGMEAHNSAVTKSAKGFCNFYSLWASIVLNETRLALPEETAERYSGFMAKVSALAKEKDARRLLKEEDEVYHLAYEYLKNSVRASTDKRQREARNEILERVLFDPTPDGAPADDDHKDDSSQQSNWPLVRNDGGRHILKLAMGKSNIVPGKDPQRNGKDG